jgi:hypothetical protein
MARLAWEVVEEADTTVRIAPHDLKASNQGKGRGPD